jgi:hypothetical protein
VRYFEGGAISAPPKFRVGFLPSLTPFATARARPSPVRARISSCSNSAKPASIVSIRRPCGVVVSAKAGLLLGDRRQDVEQVARRSRQAIEPRHQKHVAGVELVERTAKLGAIGRRAAGRLTPHLLRAGGPQLLHLRVDALAVRRYPCIGVNHGAILPLYFAPEKPFSIKGHFDVRNSLTPAYSTDVSKSILRSVERKRGTCRGLRVCCASASRGSKHRAFGFDAKRSEDHNDDCSRPGHKGERERIVATVADRDAGLLLRNPVQHPYAGSVESTKG